MDSILRLKIFNNIDYLDHMFTTRLGGKSKGGYESLNLCLNTGDNPENVKENFSIISKKMNVPVNRIFLAKQIHKDGIIRVSGKDNQGEILSGTADSLITDSPGTLICVKTADCCPILLASTEKKVVACIHSGWKGTLIKNIEKTILFMATRFSLSKNSIKMAIGPAISQRNYQIDKKRAEKFINNIDYAQKHIKQTGSKLFLDLKGLNVETALKAGIPNENIEISDQCTYGNSELFFSFRRDGRASGRHLSGILIK